MIIKQRVNLVPDEKFWNLLNNNQIIGNLGMSSSPIPDPKTAAFVVHEYKDGLITAKVNIGDKAEGDKLAALIKSGYKLNLKPRIINGRFTGAIDIVNNLVSDVTQYTESIEESKPIFCGNEIVAHLVNDEVEFIDSPLGRKFDLHFPEGEQIELEELENGLFIKEEIEDKMPLYYGKDLVGHVYDYKTIVFDDSLLGKRLKEIFKSEAPKLKTNGDKIHINQYVEIDFDVSKDTESHKETVTEEQEIKQYVNAINNLSWIQL